MTEVVLFAGPTAAGVPPERLQRGGVRVLPPVRRGDIKPLLADARPGVLLLCDGVFQSDPAVSHAEICHALDAGWQVWGVSSIGAIRAHEMRREGMRGLGWVHAQFRRKPTFTDDEVALLHLPVAPYTPLTEPLVNLRYALQMRGPALGIRAGAGRRAVQALQGLWFGDRSEDRVLDALVAAGGVAPVQARRLLAWTARHRIKTLDLLALLRQRPWLALPRPSAKARASRSARAIAAP